MRTRRDMVATEMSLGLAETFPPQYARRMSIDHAVTLDRYKELTARWTAARERATALRTELDVATAAEQALADEMAAIEVVIAKALASYKERDALDELLDEQPPRGTPEQEPRAKPEAPDGVRPSFYELMALIPLDGDVGIDVFRSNLNLSDGALSTRIIKAKNAKLIETAGRGRYRLTEQGRAILSPKLRVVQ